MINHDLNSLAFPWLLINNHGKIIDKGEGSLFELPLSSVTGTSLDFIQKIQKTGWWKCPKGWAVYSRRIGNDILVLPGLKVMSVSTISGKSELLQIKLESSYIERHVSEIILNSQKSADLSSTATRGVIHEVRAINAAVKNAAYELKGLTPQVSNQRAEDLVGNISALSELLSTMMDTQDIISSFEAVKSRPKERISPYKKFDKITRSFRATLNRKGIKISLEGESRKLIFGPDLFEIIPFLLIDNAIKYSLDSSSITCTLSEDLYSIICSVESTGPQISHDEKEKIFNVGFRGKFAIQRGIPGDGIGLSILKKTVENLYRGSIEVETDLNKPISLNGILYCTNRFTCRFPLALQTVK